jgi:hypothetical protein
MNVSRSRIAHEFGVVYSNPCPAELIVIDLEISPMAATNPQSTKTGHVHL